MKYNKPRLRKFGPYPHNSEGIPDEEEAYAQGYDTGLHWSAPWRPGGPLVFEVSARDDLDFQAYCRATNKNNQEWNRGFDDGRNANNRIDQ